jgi:hypothetical protein
MVDIFNCGADLAATIPKLLLYLRDSRAEIIAAVCVLPVPTPAISQMVRSVQANTSA